MIHGKYLLVCFGDLILLIKESYSFKLFFVLVLAQNTNEGKHKSSFKGNHTYIEWQSYSYINRVYYFIFPR